MADNILDLILRIRKAGTGAADVNADLDKIRKSGGGLVTSLTDIKSGFDLAFGAAQTVMAGAQKAFDATIGKAAEWGDSMGDLAQLTGTTVRETSELAATLELMGIKQDGLTKIVKAFTTQGLQPTMASIKSLAAQYQAIQDPVERNEFLFKRFGRQAADVAEILGKSTSELDEFAAAARTSGKVIDEEAAVAAERLNVNLAILQQRVEGAGIALGNVFIPVVNDAITAGDQLVKIWQIGNVKLREQRGEIDGATAALEMQRIVGIEPVTTATEENTAVTQDATIATDLWMEAIAEGAPAITDYYNSLDNTARIAAGLSMGLGELTTATLYHQAAAGLDGTASLELARAMGLIDEEAYNAGASLQDLRTKYDSNKDGAIDAAEAAAGYTREVLALARATELIPRTIPIDIRITKTGDEDFGGWTPPKGSTPTTTTTSDSGVVVTTGDVIPRQAGGPVLVGERGAEMFWPQTNGFVMNNNDMRRMISALEAIAGGGARSVVNMSINTQAAPSETMLGGYVRALAGAL